MAAGNARSTSTGGGSSRTMTAAAAAAAARTVSRRHRLFLPRNINNNKNRNHKKEAWMFGALVAVLVVYGMNLSRLYYHLPNKVGIKMIAELSQQQQQQQQHQMNNNLRRGRAEQNQEVEALLDGLEKELVKRRQEMAASPCRLVGGEKNQTTTSLGHLRDPTTTTRKEDNDLGGDGGDLLDFLRKSRAKSHQWQKGSDNNYNNVMQCYLPSPCPPVPETKVAVVLVLRGRKQQRGDQQSLLPSINWREIMVDCLKILQQSVVTEVWVLIPDQIISGGSSSSNLTTIVDDRATSQNDLYQQRFHLWYQQHSKAGRIRPIVVKKERHGSWLKAINEIDNESTATAIIWAEKPALDTTLSSIRAQDKHYQNGTIMWQSFVNQRVKEWEKSRARIHVSHQVQYTVDFSLLGSPSGCSTHWQESNYLSMAGDGRSTGKTVPHNYSDVVTFPYIHGVVHDKAWICFWKHAALKRFLVQNDGGDDDDYDGWSVVSSVAILWMAHLAGGAKKETMNVVTTFADDVDPESTRWAPAVLSRMLFFFGGFGFSSAKNSEIESRICDT